MGWEDTWIPLLWDSLTNQDHKTPESVVELLPQEHLEQETRNHRLLRVAYGYRALPQDSPDHRAVRDIVLEILGDESEDFMGHEVASPTYGPFWEQGMGALLWTAAEQEGGGDQQVVEPVQRWWEGLRALYAWMSVPEEGVRRQPKPRDDTPVYGDVLPVSLRAKRPRNRDEGIMLRLLCGETTNWDRQQIEKSGGNLNLQQLLIVHFLLRNGRLKERDLDPEALREHLPPVHGEIHIERWKGGFRAWAPRLEGLGPAQQWVWVHHGEMKELRTPETAKVRKWSTDETPPDPADEVQARVTLGG